MLSSDTIRVLKFGSWATSAGHADWYAMETISPEFKGDFSNLAVFVVYKVSFHKNKYKITQNILTLSWLIKLVYQI